MLSYKLDSLIKKKKKLKDISKFDSLTWAHVELMVQMFKWLSFLWADLSYLLFFLFKKKLFCLTSIETER